MSDSKNYVESPVSIPNILDNSVELVKKADAGDPDAINRMNNIDLTRDFYTKELVNYVKNNPDRSYSLFILGNIYSSGIEVEKDNEKAIEYYEKSANLGNPLSAYNLILEQKLIKTDELVKMLKRAIKLGSRDACVDLGYLYYEGILEYGMEESLCTYQIDVNKKKAFKYLLIAANLGSGISAVTIGHMYRDGESIDENIDKAIEYYMKAHKDGEFDGTDEAIYWLEAKNRWYELAQVCLDANMCYTRGKFRNCLRKIITQSDFDLENFYKIIKHDNFHLMFDEWNPMPEICNVIKNLVESKINLMEMHFNYAPNAEGFLDAKADFFGNMNKN